MPPVQSLAVLWSDHSSNNLVTGAFKFSPRAWERGWLVAVSSCFSLRTQTYFQLLLVCAEKVFSRRVKQEPKKPDALAGYSCLEKAHF